MRNVLEKKTYVAPELKVHGTIEEITHGQTTGTQLDATFPAGTDFGVLTFS